MRARFLNLEAAEGELVRTIAWLLSLLPGVVSGQVRPRARRVVNGWTKHNGTWKALGYGPIQRVLFWGAAHPLQFIGALGFASLGLACALGLPIGRWSAIVRPAAIAPEYDLAPFVGVPWSIQATVVSLVYPIVLSYIALLLQRRARSPARQHVYQLDSAVVPAGSSSLALLLVMSAEYFLVPFFSSDARTKYLTVLLLWNWAWLTLNLMLTAYFVSRTVKFIQDSAQDKALTRVAVVVALRDELRLAMQQHLLANAPEADWQLAGLNDEDDFLPRVAMFKLGDGKPAVTLQLTGEHVLHDVHLRLLAFVTRGWTKRAMGDAANRSPRICFPPLIGEVSPEKAVLCTVENGPPLTWLERLLVTSAFDFRKVRTEALVLRTRDVLQELSFEVQAAADARQFDASREALRRMYRLHKTLLLASESSSGGVAQSVASMSVSPYGWSSSSFGTEWLWAYRALAATASRLIGEDSRMFAGLAQIPANIANALPAVPAQPILDGMEAVGSALSHELGAWWTRSADESLATSTTPFNGELPPPLNKAYEYALTTFVGSWGHLRVAPLEAASEADVWESLRARTLVYARHIDLSAQFFLKAVARGDSAGAEWFLESFIKWWGNRAHELETDVEDEFQVRHVTLSLASKSLDEAREFLRIDHNQVSLSTATNALNLGLKRYWESMRLYLATLLVHYAGDLPAADSRELKLAAVLVRGKAQRRGGSVECEELGSMDLVLTAALAVLYGVESPEGRINSFSEKLRWDSEAPEVSGWVYGWAGSPTNFRSMKTALLTLLLALPAPRLCRATAARRLVETWWKDFDKLSSVASHLAELRRMALSGGFNAWAPAVQVLQSQLGTSGRVRTSRRALSRVFENLRRTAVHERLITIRSIAVDDQKVRRLAAAISSSAFAAEAWPASKRIELRFVPGLSESIQHLSLEDYKTRYLKGVSDSLDDGMVKHAADEVRRFAKALPLQRLLGMAGITPANSPHLRKDYRASAHAAQDLLLAIGKRAADVRARGESPVAIVGHGAVGTYLNHFKWGDADWQYPLPQGVSVTGSDLADFARALCLVNDCPVYRMDTPQGDCYVLPASLIAKLEVSGASPGQVLSVTWEQVNDERIAMRLSWSARFAPKPSA